MVESRDATGDRTQGKGCGAGTLASEPEGIETTTQKLVNSTRLVAGSGFRYRV